MGGQPNRVELARRLSLLTYFRVGLPRQLAGLTAGHVVYSILVRGGEFPLVRWVSPVNSSALWGVIPMMVAQTACSGVSCGADRVAAHAMVCLAVRRIRPTPLTVILCNLRSQGV